MAKLANHSKKTAAKIAEIIGCDPEKIRYTETGYVYMVMSPDGQILADLYFNRTKDGSFKVKYETAMFRDEKIKTLNDKEQYTRPTEEPGLKIVK